MKADEMFVSEKQYAIFVQREDDQCPFKKELVMEAAKETIKMMTNIKNHEDYVAMTEKLEELVGGDKNIAAEIRYSSLKYSQSSHSATVRATASSSSKAKATASRALSSRRLSSVHISTSSRLSLSISAESLLRKRYHAS